MKVKVTLSYEYDAEPLDYLVDEYSDQEVLLTAIKEIDLDPQNLIEAIDYLFSYGKDYTVTLERVDGA